MAAARRPGAPRGPRLAAANWQVGDRFELRYDYSTEGLSLLAGALGRITLIRGPPNSVAFVVFDSAPTHAPVPVGLPAIARPVRQANPPMTVTLGHRRNPDIAAGYWRLPVDPGRKHKVPVASIEEAVLVSRAFIERNGLGGGNWAGGQVHQGGKLIGRVAYNGRFFARTAEPPRPNPSRSKPPAATRVAAPRQVRVARRELNAAVELFHKFREAPPRRVRLARFRVPQVCVVIGEMDFVGYTTTHAKKRARYRHDFSRGARPLLCASSDGRQLLIFGGNYDFTRDGIVDRA